MIKTTSTIIRKKIFIVMYAAKNLIIVRPRPHCDLTGKEDQLFMREFLPEFLDLT